VKTVAIFKNDGGENDGDEREHAVSSLRVL